MFMRDNASAAGRSAPVSALLFATLIAYAITCIAFVICAVLLRYTEFQESHVPMFVTMTSVLAVLVSGFDTARGADKDGWVWGLFAGIAYAIIWICLSVLITRSFNLSMRTITVIIMSVAGGGLGGMIGINFKKKKK